MAGVTANALVSELTGRTHPARRPRQERRDHALRERAPRRRHQGEGAGRPSGPTAAMSTITSPKTCGESGVHYVSMIDAAPDLALSSAAPTQEKHG